MGPDNLMKEFDDIFFKDITGKADNSRDFDPMGKVGPKYLEFPAKKCGEVGSDKGGHPQN
jgi:hypothetical protein